MTPFLFSASTSRSWRKCPRAFFNGTLRDGTGYDSTFVDEDLLFGTVVHEQLPLLWQGKTAGIPDAVSNFVHDLVMDSNWLASFLPEVREQKSLEWGRLLEGILWGIQLVQLPFLRERYQLRFFEHDALKWVEEGVSGLMAKPDTVLLPLVEDDFALPGNGYLEWKTCASAGEAWQKGHEGKNPQIWTGALALRAQDGIDLDWYQACGMVKGTETKDQDGVAWHNSPFCWAYRYDPSAITPKRNKPLKIEATAITASDGSRWSWEGTTAVDWPCTSTSEFPGGVEEWVKALPPEVVARQFVMTEPVVIDWDLAEEWLGNQGPMIEAALEWQRHGAERNFDVPGARESILQELFPRMLEECDTGMWGKSCRFKAMCHEPLVAAEPLVYYKKRVPHHEIERRLYE